jgi:hypothetical protein
MSLLTNTYYRFSAAIRAFMNPEELLDYKQARMDESQFAWAYYSRKMFAANYDWSWYFTQNAMYKKTRYLINPVTPLVDFYVDNIWTAARSERFPALATPLLESTDEKITAAVAQVDQWVNWLSEAQKIKKYAAAAGSVLVEVIDDDVREKVLQKTHWHGEVSDLELNNTGDVLSYTLEYDVYDSAINQTYRYKKIVTKDETSYFRDNAPFVPEGAESTVEPNLYGFVPAVWIRHSDDGGIKGTPACRDFGKVDHANSLISHLHDNIHKEIESGKIISMAKPESLRVLTGGTVNSDGTVADNDPRLDRVLLAVEGEASVHDLSGMLKLAEAHPYLKDLILSFADDYPELEYRQILKEKGGTMSGVALERLLTPAQNRLDGVQANYNQQLTKLRQMQLAIAGWRANNWWKRKTKQQMLFTPFSLESYERGELDFYIKPSLLIEPTVDEVEDLMSKKAERAKTLETVIDHEEQLKIAGFNEEQRKEILTRFEQAAARQQIEGGQPALVGGKPAIQLGAGLPVEE